MSCGYVILNNAEPTRLPRASQARGADPHRIASRGEVIAELAPPVASPDRIAAARARLRGSVRRYGRPLEPVFALKEWDMNR